MQYVPSKRKRGRPRKFQGDEIISIGGKPKEIKSQDEMEILKKEVAELKSQLASFIDVGEKKVEEKTIPIDWNKIEKGNILNATERDRIETKIAQLEHQLTHSETSLGREMGKHGGMTECFIRNDAIDKRVFYDRMMHAKYSLQVGTHGKLSDADKNRLYQMKKDIEKELKDTSISLSKQNSPDEAIVNEAADYLTKHKEKYEKLRVKLKNINKILMPENPEAGSLTFTYTQNNMFKVQFYYMEATPSGGSVSWNTESMYGECINLYVKPATSTTVYRIKITGPNGFILYESRGTTATETGELTLVGLSTVGLVNGIYTCAITLASVDELFKVQMGIKQYSVAK